MENVNVNYSSYENLFLLWIILLHFAWSILNTDFIIGYLFKTLTND